MAVLTLPAVLRSVSVSSLILLVMSLSRGLRGAVLRRASISAQLKPSNQRCFLMSAARPLSMPMRRAGLRSSRRPIRS